MEHTLLLQIVLLIGVIMMQTSKTGDAHHVQLQPITPLQHRVSV
jgi:hypothetical protein